MKIIQTVTCMVLLAITSMAHAKAIFVITPTITSTYLRSDSYTQVPYTVTNNTNVPLNGVTIDPAYNNTAHFSINNNTCNNLSAGATCTFNLVIPGQNQPTSFIVSPRICAFNQTVCSQPVLSGRLTVTVNQITQAVHAFVGLSNNTVLPIQLVAGSAGTAGTAISGFSLNEPAGIAVNLAGTMAYVTNTGSNQVFAITISSNKISGVFNVGSVPAAVAVSPDGTKLYVANYNAGQVNGTISVLNAASGALLATVAIGGGPWGVAITPDGSKLYVANSYDNTVSVMDTASNSLISSINVGTAPLGIVASPDGTKVYVTNTQSDSVSVIQTNINQVINTIAVGDIPKGLAINSDGSRLYVANWQDGTIDIINTATGVTGTPITLVPGLLGLALSPDGTQLYVTIDQVNAVAVVNTQNASVQYLSLAAPQVTLGSFIG